MVEKVKGVVFRLLEATTAHGDRVALVAFRGGVPEGTVVLPLTSSIALARRRLRAIPLSGQTPLADAVRRARILLRQERFKHTNAIPLVVVVTDGLPTVPLRSGGDPVHDVLAEARALRRAGMLCIVADSALEDSGGCSGEIARVSGGIALPIAELAPDVLAEVMERIA